MQETIFSAKIQHFGVSILKHAHFALLGGSVGFSIANTNSAIAIDSYIVSLAGGFNLLVLVIPLRLLWSMSDLHLPTDINIACPTLLRERGPNGSVICCRNACWVFILPQFWCTSPYGKVETCLQKNYSILFEILCPLAYNYPFDDN